MNFGSTRHCCTQFQHRWALSLSRWIWTISLTFVIADLVQATPVPEPSKESKEKVALFQFPAILNFEPLAVEAFDLETQEQTNNMEVVATGRAYEYLGGHPGSHERTDYYYPMHFASHSPYPYDYHGERLNPLAVVAVVLFGAIAFLLLLRLLGVPIARSLPSGPTSLPLEFWNTSGEIIPELMVRAAEWLEQSKWTLGNGTETVRIRRSVDNSKETKLRDWIRAYRKDPNNYSCIRKLACEILANSTLAERSVKSPLGGTIMSMLGRAIQHGPEVVDLVTEVVGDPEKCMYFAPDDACD